MTIADFDFEAGLLGQFLEFPQRLHASDPNWMPDPAGTRLLTDGGSRPARWRNFLALERGEVRGRVTAILNPRLCDGKDRPYGQLGFFECVNDLSVAKSLVDAAIGWLSANLPAGGSLLAPMNFDTWHPYRFRTMGFEEPTFFMEPYNPSHYPDLFSELGFAPVSRYITKTVNGLAPLLEFWEAYHRDLRAKGFSIRSFALDAVQEELSLIYRLSLDMFRENLFFTDISEAEFRALYAGAARRLDPDLFLFLLDPKGEPAGLCFSIPDHRQPQTVNVKTFGVLPQFRNAGVGAGFAYEIYSRFQAKGFTRVNHCLMRAGNRADNFDGGLGKVTREYALFTRSIRR